MLDWILTPKFGLSGAAVATAVSQAVGGIIPLIYFFGKNNTSKLNFVPFKFDFKSLVKVCSNGSSEFLSNIAMSLVSILYNYQLMRYAQEDGVSAYGVLMYVSMIFQAIYIGYSVGISPVIGFHYGAENKKELHSLLKKSLTFVGICAVAMFLAGELLAEPFSRLFVGYDETLLDITSNAFKIFSFSFLLSGFSIFGSSFFTSLNDGFTSAAISFLRTVVFQVAAVIVFPLIWEINGIWFSIVAAEVMSVAVTVLFLILKKKKYGY